MLSHALFEYAFLDLQAVAQNFTGSKGDGFVKSLKMSFSVFPAEFTMPVLRWGTREGMKFPLAPL